MHPLPHVEELNLPIVEQPAIEEPSINKRHGASGKHKKLPAIYAQLNIENQILRKRIQKEDLETKFILELPALKGRLEAEFELADGSSQGAYYVYVERLELKS